MTEKPPFWSTVPGMLTGIAAVITAVGGLVVALSQTGILGGGDEEPAIEAISVHDTASSNDQHPNEAPEEQPKRPPLEANGNAMIGKTPEASVTSSGAARIDILSSANGGQVLAATSDQWLATIDGKETRDFLL